MTAAAVGRAQVLLAAAFDAVVVPRPVVVLVAVVVVHEGLAGSTAVGGFLAATKAE